MNFDEFIDFLKKHTTIKWNYQNIEHMKHLYDIFINMNVQINKKNDKTIYSKIIQPMLRQVRSKKVGTTLCIEYWQSIGYTDIDEIKSIISLEQKRRSKRSLEYWLHKGYSIEDAKIEQGKYQTDVTKKGWKNNRYNMLKNNPMFKYYWIDNGYSIEEAQQKVNPFSSGYRLGPDFAKPIKEKLSIKMKYLHKTTDIWTKHIIDLGNIMISKEEMIFFNYITEYIPDIQYKKYGINIRNIECEKCYKICDGYLKYNDNDIILFEYDGTYWHNPEYDNFLDNEILKIRPDIKGIIRVNDKYFKQNKNELIKDIKNAIEEIKNNEKRICRFWC